MAYFKTWTMNCIRCGRNLTLLQENRIWICQMGHQIRYEQDVI